MGERFKDPHWTSTIPLIESAMDVDNHLFTSAVHREAESEQMIIARKIENREIEMHDKQGVEDLKDEMDDVRRERARSRTGRLRCMTSRASRTSRTRWTMCAGSA